LEWGPLRWPGPRGNGGRGGCGRGVARESAVVMDGDLGVMSAGCIWMGKKAVARSDGRLGVRRQLCWHGRGILRGLGYPGVGAVISVCVGARIRGVGGKE
jgi:hypothetical protein